MSKTSHGPPPLRSAAFPNGLPPHMLSPNMLARVRAANRLYLFMQKLIESLSGDKVWTIENPLRSWLWNTVYFERISKLTTVYMIQFDMCMFGGRRLKRTGVATNCEHLQNLARACDGNHQHLPFGYSDGRFDTSLEAEYPIKFCEVLVQGVAEHLQRYHGWNSLDSAKRLKQSTVAAHATHKQSKRSPSLVQEFQRFIKVPHVPRHIQLPLDSKQNLSRCVEFTCNSGALHIHAHNRLLRRTSKGGVNRADSEQNSGVHDTVAFDLLRNKFDAGEIDDFAKCMNAPKQATCENTLFVKLEDKGQEDDLIFGIYWEPEIFLTKLATAGHPQHMFSGVSEEVSAAIRANVEMEYHEVVVHRCKWFGKYLKLAEELKLEDQVLLGHMRPEMQAVLKTKRISLLKRIIHDEGYMDETLADDIANGFNLVGEIPGAGGRLPPKFVPATLAVSELIANSARARKAIQFGKLTSGDDHMDLELYKKTLDEVERGWLLGPVPWEELEPYATVSKRFGIQQGPKLRPIDDYSMSSVNATVSSRDQATADNVDTICAMMLQFMDMLQLNGRSSSIEARSFDLAAAYRQLCVAADSRPFSYIGVYNPHKKCNEVFSQVCLPFGSKAAVNAFIRCSRCIQWIAAKALLLPTTCYYDDFVVVTTPELRQNSEQSMSLLFDLLGWAFDREGPKADSFSSEVASLGVHISLQSSFSGTIYVRNTDKRKAEVRDLLDELLEWKTLEYKAGQVLRGKMAFAQTQIAGLCAKYVLQMISQHVHCRPFKAAISDELYSAIVLFRDMLCNSPPRSISMSMKYTKFILTDASFEPDGSGGIGGVLCNEDGSINAWFQRALTCNDVKYFMEKGHENAIAELETLAPVLAVFLWHEKLSSQHVVFCLDNDVSRFAFIKGYSNSKSVSSLVRVAAIKFEAHTILPWFLRVASASNLSDYPSRMKSHEMLTRDKMTPSDVVNSCVQQIVEFLNSSP